MLCVPYAKYMLAACYCHATVAAATEMKLDSRTICVSVAISQSNGKCILVADSVASTHSRVKQQ